MKPLRMPNLAFGVALMIAASWAVADTTPTQLRVVWTEKPQTSALIAWSTVEASDDNAVHFDTKSGGSKHTAYGQSVKTHKSAAYSSDKPPLHYHHAKLEGLKPDTTYYFVVRSGAKVLGPFNFRTAPDTDKPFTVLFGGDSRSGHDARQKVNAMIAQMTAARSDILAFAHGGDYVGSGKRLDHWDKWMTHHQLVITKKGRILPLIPARGNHESSGPLYDEVFGYPGGGIGKNYFATRLSPAVLFVTLNSETSVDGDQKKFLEDTLKGAGDYRWRVAQYHRPAYPAVKSPGRTKRWVPLFEEHKVQLVCEADGHNIKRTPPILKDKVDPNGVVYVGEGGLGVGQRTPKTDRWYLKKPGMASKGHHVMLLEFGPKTLTVKTILLGGKTFDTYTIKTRP